MFLPDLLLQEVEGPFQVRGDPLLSLRVYSFDVKCWACVWLFLHGRNTGRNSPLLPAERVTQRGPSQALFLSLRGWMACVL